MHNRILCFYKHFQQKQFQPEELRFPLLLPAFLQVFAQLFEPEAAESTLCSNKNERCE